MKARDSQPDSDTQSAPADAPLRGEVIGMIEHEVRTAATVVRGYLGMLLSEKQGPLNPEQWAFSSEARRAVDRVLLLLDNLLDVASTGEPLPVVCKPLRVHDVLRLAVDAARPLADDAGLKVRLELDADADEIRGDGHRLEQVFVNLIANAATAAPGGSELLVSTSSAELAGGEQLSIAFADEGPGVEEDNVERIFRPFVQGHRTPGVASGGVGLGLAICRRIVAEHGGEIETLPSLGYGLFRVTLPIARAESERG